MTESSTTYLSSPNFITSQLFNEAARQLEEMHDGEDNCAKVAGVIVLIMAGLESFLNSYFHLLAFQLKKNEFLKIVTTCTDDKGHVSTRRKILEWPKQILGKSIDQNSSEYKNYDKARILRDKLVHYKPDEMKWGRLGDSLKIVPEHKISFYKSLTKAQGIKSFGAVVDLIGMIGDVTGGRSKEPHRIVFIANWTGRWPDQMPSNSGETIKNPAVRREGL